MKGKMRRWRGRGANEEEDVPMKWNMWPSRGRCAHEGEDVPMKRKMCQWSERCGHEDVATLVSRSWKQERSRKQASRESARKHPSTKNGLRVSLRAGCPPVYRAVTTKKTRLTWGRFPFWLYNIFQRGWNHQPEYRYIPKLFVFFLMAQVICS